MKGTDKKNKPGRSWGWGGGCASGRKYAKWDFHFIKRLLERLTALQRDKRRTWGTGKREGRLPSRTDLTPTPGPKPSLYKIQKQRDEIRNPSLASVQHNQSCPAATGAQQPPGYFRSRTALCSLGQDLLLFFFFFFAVTTSSCSFTALQNYFITHPPCGLHPWIIPQYFAITIKNGTVFFLAAGLSYSDMTHYIIHSGSCVFLCGPCHLQYNK